MNRRRSNNLMGRVIELERLRCPKGGRFFMIWGRDQIELTDALHKAMAAGDVQASDRFNAKIWTCPTPPPAARWVSLDRVSHSELVILAEAEAKTGSSDDRSLNVARYSDAELSS